MGGRRETVEQKILRVAEIEGQQDGESRSDYFARIFRVVSDPDSFADAKYKKLSGKASLWVNEQCRRGEPATCFPDAPEPSDEPEEPEEVSAEPIDSSAAAEVVQGEASFAASGESEGGAPAVEMDAAACPRRRRKRPTVQNEESSPVEQAGVDGAIAEEVPVGQVRRRKKVRSKSKAARKPPVRKRAAKSAKRTKPAAPKVRKKVRPKALSVAQIMAKRGMGKSAPLEPPAPAKPAEARAKSAEKPLNGIPNRNERGFAVYYLRRLCVENPTLQRAQIAELAEAGKVECSQGTIDTVVMHALETLRVAAKIGYRLVKN